MKYWGLFSLLYNQNEIARFQPSFDHGLVQFFGEALLLAIVAFIARKWLRINFESYQQQPHGIGNTRIILCRTKNDRSVIHIRKIS